MTASPQPLRAPHVVDYRRLKSRSSDRLTIAPSTNWLLSLILTPVGSITESLYITPMLRVLGGGSVNEAIGTASSLFLPLLHFLGNFQALPHFIVNPAEVLACGLTWPISSVLNAIE